jgi:hypothetical protein
VPKNQSLLISAAKKAREVTDSARAVWQLRMSENYRNYRMSMFDAVRGCFYRENGEHLSLLNCTS